MLWDTMQRALTWFLTCEIVGLVAGALAGLGVPPWATALLACGLLLLVVHKITSDRFMLQRWKRKLNNWRYR